MPLARFDSEKHHIGIAPEGSPDLFGFLLAGSYQVGGQQYGSPQEFGGQNELISDPSLSRWNQDDFTGGCFQYTWGKDPAMFAGSYNIIPSSFDRSVRTVPPLSRVINTSAIGNRAPIIMFPVQGQIIGLFGNGIARWSLVPGSQNLYGDLTTFGRPFGRNPDWIWAGCFDPLRRDLFYFTFDPTDGTSAIERMRVPNMLKPYTHINSNREYDGLYPPNTGNLVSAMAVIGDLLVVQSGSYAYGCTLPDNSNGVAYITPTWQKLGRLPGTWRDSVVYNGALYVLCSSQEQNTVVVTIDPKLFGTPNTSSVLPVCEFPYNFRGDSICTMGGRVYVGGSGTDFQGGSRYAELYEITGSSLRLLRTFEPESKAQNLGHRPKTIHSMVAHEGLLFWGDQGRGLMAYDPTTDSFYGASLLSPPDGVRDLWHITSVRERLYVYVTHPGDPSQNGLNRPAISGTDNLAAFSGVVYTSDFGPEPDRRKRWSELRVLTRGGGVQAGWSEQGGSPGGDTFAPLAGTEEQHADYRITTFDLCSIPATTQIRFALTMPRGTDTSSFTELISFTTSFRFLDSGKFNWRFTVNGTARVESANGDETLILDTHDIRTELRRYWRDQIPLTFRDVNGESYRCVVSSFQESQPIVGPMNPVGDPITGKVDFSREAFYNITLTEV